ncbi:MAG: hypothetical protein Q4E77_09510 [Conchiformibius sp.]|nr:hypothetical protein [Conchiformibius sp.]
MSLFALHTRISTQKTAWQSKQRHALIKHCQHIGNQIIPPPFLAVHCQVNSLI